MRSAVRAAVLGVMAVGLCMFAGAGMAVADVKTGAARATSRSVRSTCRSVEAATQEVQDALARADEARRAAATSRLAKIERRAGTLPADLATQLRLVVRTLQDPPKSPVTLRAVRISGARLAHGL